MRFIKYALIFGVVLYLSLFLGCTLIWNMWIDGLWVGVAGFFTSIIAFILIIVVLIFVLIPRTPTEIAIELISVGKDIIKAIRAKKKKRVEDENSVPCHSRFD